MYFPTKTLLTMLGMLLAAQQVAFGVEPPSELERAERGLWFLLNRAYVPVEFDQEVLDNIWNVWPKAERKAVEDLSPETRRQHIFERYGLTPRPGDSSGKPLQYVVDRNGQWTSNCFSCHGGKVAGQVIPGLPNSLYALQTLTEDSAASKEQLGKRLSGKELGVKFFPLGSTVGTTNAVIFGVVLGHYRDNDLNLILNAEPPKLVHHDMDAPPWWHFKKRKRLYIDGFAQKGHRALMPFMLTRENGPEKFRQWEADFEDVFAYLESLEASKYPFEVDAELADQGQSIFNRHCADCHGTYGEKETYPHRIVPLDEIGTDPVRYKALPVEHRRRYGEGWFAHYGKQETVSEPEGYLAPPLDGIWASAPYFHNGSVPTLWHVLNPDERPAIWRRSIDGYNQEDVGLEIETFDRVPSEDNNRIGRRSYFNTKRFGKSAAGHNYPNRLTDDEKRSLLEYLKTL